MVGPMLDAAARLDRRLGVIERLQERGGGREAVLARLLHRLHHRLLQRQRHVDGRVDVADARRRVREVHRDDLDLVLGLERAAARQHLEQDHAGGVDVGARVDRLAQRLLGRQVFGRAEDDARLRERLAPRLRLGHLRDAEVEDLDDLALPVALDQHDVLGLEVAMDDAGGVRVLEPAQDLADDRERPRRRHRPGRDRVRTATRPPGTPSPGTASPPACGRSP